ncbi:hypothetical protein [Flavobacterium terrigena]|uniref:Uncharacterized protein n=1 Tax=Flavobacterium terrigena TaxID=402734 RepID=A0A1H6QPE8_9FLAO|nr:hypothetical protein [Flavobacterium terrigena]SEI42844.1 hypothetical protein SAMN05660918_0511 [Flavobacterium terrigena]
MEEIIYCVEILKQKYELLNKDRKFFFRIQRFEECAFLRHNEKQIEVIVKKLLEECKIILVNSECEGNSELLTRYNTLLSYFDLDFDTRKAKLEMQLSIQKKNLKSISAIFNFRTANRIREEIKETEKELVKIKALIKGENL